MWSVLPEVAGKWIRKELLEKIVLLLQNYITYNSRDDNDNKIWQQKKYGDMIMNDSHLRNAQLYGFDCMRISAILKRKGKKRFPLGWSPQFFLRSKERPDGMTPVP